MWDDGSGVVLKAEEKAKEEIEQRKAEQKEEVGYVKYIKRNLCRMHQCLSGGARRSAFFFLNPTRSFRGRKARSREIP